MRLRLEKGTVTRTELFINRSRFVFGLCGKDGAEPDPLKGNGDFIRTMSENGVPMDGALEFEKSKDRDKGRGDLYRVQRWYTVPEKWADGGE